VKNKALVKAIRKLNSNRRCELCPLDTLWCRSTSRAIFGEEKCLILVAVSEILTFYTEEHRKSLREQVKKEVKPMDKQWTMNCVLAGAAVQRLVDEGKFTEAKKKLRELSSELDQETVEYLLRRIEDRD